MPKLLAEFQTLIILYMVAMVKGLIGQSLSGLTSDYKINDCFQTHTPPHRYFGTLKENFGWFPSKSYSRGDK